MGSKDYKDLIVWQKSMDFAMLIYRLTASFPDHERFGLISQMRRCAVSIPSNIAEGSKRRTTNDFVQFLLIAYGSCAELETQLLIARKLAYGEDADYMPIEDLLREISKMLHHLTNCTFKHE